ncbi:hypothetical protein ER308_05550 [Egibacter rhizosphaerae]|uniref:Heme A synthase n=1 Tax=Egibacter rhizosphaerae TaxID=1670831 RepID=A0A411YD18_9ACTN|nr:COX15/CtaA family protein [Egibacter rhizosphaerae]QBI19062.1 hypothetical protein ER308_05550 [Egibacter rhizosphaerae]
MTRPSVRLLAWATLVGTFVLNLQGTLVRATGSGDGCGPNWPLCHGNVVPVDPGFSTLMEYGHRQLTIAVGLLGLVLLVQAVRHRRRHPGVLAAVLVAAAFFAAQALVGRITVVWELTGDSADPLRALILPTHLVNSFSQLAALALAVLYAGPRAPGRWRMRERAGTAGILLVSAVAFYGLVFTGGISALGDLYAPADSVAEGAALDFSPDAPWPARVRLTHPVLAMVLAFVLLGGAAAVPGLRRTWRVTRLAAWLGGVYLLQLVVGTWNLLALAPLPLSALHQALAMVAFALFAVLAAVALGGGDEGSMSSAAPERAGRAPAADQAD